MVWVRAVRAFTDENAVPFYRPQMHSSSPPPRSSMTHFVVSRLETIAVANEVIVVQ
jgi:hypothetical protein